jgi:hypothetical protein
VPQNSADERDDFRLQLADQLDLDDDHKLADTVRWCAENHPDGCDICDWLAEDLDDGWLPRPPEST